MSQINEINPRNHEEADTRMLLHPAVHAAKHGHTKSFESCGYWYSDVRNSPDLKSTYPSALVGFWCFDTSLCHTCATVRTGLANASIFSLYHSLTGCDTLSDFAGRGNKLIF